MAFGSIQDWNTLRGGGHAAALAFSHEGNEGKPGHLNAHVACYDITWTTSAKRLSSWRLHIHFLNANRIAQNAGIGAFQKAENSCGRKQRRGDHRRPRAGRREQPGAHRLALLFAASSRREPLSEIYSAAGQRIRMHNGPAFLFVSLFGFALLHGGGTWRGRPDGRSEQDQVPVFKTQSRAVVVDVVVTKGDEAVTGLRKQDFQALEDGKPVTLDFFEEHTARSLPPGAAPALPKLPAHVYSNVPPAPESDSVNVLLLDTLNTDRPDQANVHQQIIDFLKTMQPGVRVAVFVLGSRLRMVQGFTTDSSVLRDAVNDKKNGMKMEADTSVTRSLQDKFDDIEEKQRLAHDADGRRRLSEALSAMQQDFVAYQADQRVAMTLEALNYLGRYLAGVPGRKNLIWFASSFPVTVFPSPKEKQSFGQIQQYTAALSGKPRTC